MDDGSSQHVVMGISWSRDPQGFQHTLAKCWDLLPAGEGVVVCPYVHNMALHADECRQCDALKDDHLGFLNHVSCHLIAKSIASP
jgi:hypothetical protein